MANSLQEFGILLQRQYLHMAHCLSSTRDGNENCKSWYSVKDLYLTPLTFMVSLFNPDLFHNLQHITDVPSKIIQVFCSYRHSVMPSWGYIWKSRSIHFLKAWEVLLRGICFQGWIWWQLPIHKENQAGSYSAISKPSCLHTKQKIKKHSGCHVNLSKLK